MPFADRISTEESVSAVKGETVTLPFFLSPDGCYPEAIRLTSSDESVVSILKTPGYDKLTAADAGTATITAETEYSHKTVQCVVVVEYPELQVTVSGGGYSSSSMVVVNGYAMGSKSLGFSASASAQGGSGEYQYKFDLLRNGAVIKSSGWQSESSADLTVSSGGTYTIQVTVRDSRGVTATASDTSTLS